MFRIDEETGRQSNQILGIHEKLLALFNEFCVLD